VFSDRADAGANQGKAMGHDQAPDVKNGSTSASSWSGASSAM
jgi:hypothetical protein